MLRLEWVNFCAKQPSANLRRPCAASSMLGMHRVSFRAGNSPSRFGIGKIETKVALLEMSHFRQIVRLYGHSLWLSIHSTMQSTADNINMDRAKSIAIYEMFSLRGRTRSMPGTTSASELSSRLSTIAVAEELCLNTPMPHTLELKHVHKFQAIVVAHRVPPRPLRFGDCSTRFVQTFWALFS